MSDTEIEWDATWNWGLTWKTLERIIPFSLWGFCGFKLTLQVFSIINRFPGLYLFTPAISSLFHHVAPENSLYWKGFSKHKPLFKAVVTAGWFISSLEWHHVATKSCEDSKLLQLGSKTEPGACTEAKWQWAPLILCSNPPLLKATCPLLVEVRRSPEHLIQHAQ